MKYQLTIFVTLFLHHISYTQALYKFDSLAKVNGCSNVALQKISKDFRYELMVELKIDSLPKFQELNIKKYSKFVTVYMNKYGIGNKHISDICDDLIYIDPEAKEPVKYQMLEGVIIINNWTSKQFTISATLKNVVLKNKANETIQLSSEFFDTLHVGWRGG